MLQSVNYIFTDGAREKNRLLLNYSGVAFVADGVEAAQFFVPIRNRAYLWIIKSLHQLNNGRLTTARRAYKGDGTVLADFNGDTLEYSRVLFGRIGELHILKAYVANLKLLQGDLFAALNRYK